MKNTAAEHIKNVAGHGGNPEPAQDHDSSSNSPEIFNSDLCHAMVSANIPIWKLENNVFKHFLEKYTGHVIPHESTIRKSYVDGHCTATMEKIRNHKLWLAVDECTDTT